MLKLTAILAAVVLVIGGTVPAAPPEIPPPDTFIPFEVAPQPLPDFSEGPAYPEAAKPEKVDARVVTKVYVDRYGEVGAFKIVSDTHPCYGFGTKVAEAMPYWKFTPAIQSGDPVGVWISIPFNFRFKDVEQKSPSPDQGRKG